MTDVDEPAGSAVDLGTALRQVLQSLGNGADLLVRRTGLDDVHEDEPESELAAQAASDPRCPLRGLRVVRAADDRAGHQFLLHSLSWRLASIGPHRYRVANPSRRRGDLMWADGGRRACTGDQVGSPPTPNGLSARWLEPPPRGNLGGARHANEANDPGRRFSMTSGAGQARLRADGVHHDTAARPIEAAPIVAAVDGSSANTYAVETAVNLAAELDAPIVFVYVRRGPAAFLGAPAY